MRDTLRVIASGRLAPALNMGLDEALLSHPGPPTLRFYGWSPPGLSLGYFQASGPFRSIPGHHVVVRRLTGGGAIYHDDELTFALTVDAALLPVEIPASYRLVHRAVQRALRACGVTALDASGHGPRPKARPDEPWCLMTPGPCDLLARGGGKLFGSAQRRIRRPRARVLLHGSRVVRAPEATPTTGAVSEDGIDPRTIEADLRTALARELANALDLDAVIAELLPAELERGHQLAESRYGNDAFTYRR